MQTPHMHLRFASFAVAALLRIVQPS